MGLFSTNLSIRASKMSSVYYCTISYCNIPHRTRSCCPHVWNYTLLQSMVLSSELTIPFHTVLHQTKLNSTLLHRILFLRLASPEQHTLYVTLSSSLSSTIICPPQNPLAVLVLMFELLLCDINIRILLKPFPGFMFGTTWSMDASTTSLQTVIELQLICTQVDLELHKYLDYLSVNQNVLDHRCRARSQASIQKTSLLVWGALLGSLSTSLYYISLSLGFGNIRL